MGWVQKAVPVAALGPSPTAESAGTGGHPSAPPRASLLVVRWCHQSPASVARSGPGGVAPVLLLLERCFFCTKQHLEGVVLLGLARLARFVPRVRCFWLSGCLYQ